MEIYPEGGARHPFDRTDPGDCKEERKAVLSGGAPNTLAGFAYLIIFFQGIQFKKKSVGKFPRPYTGYLNLPVLLF